MTTLFVIGRIIFGLYFIYNAINHFSHVGSMAAYAKSKGVPAASLAIVVTGLLLFFGGASILFGIFPLIGIILLLIFLIPVSFTMHNFWAIEEPMEKMTQTINFMKNMALIGALLMFFMIAHPWPVCIVF